MADAPDCVTEAAVQSQRVNALKRLEVISKGLGIHSQDLKLPAQKLLASKSVKTTGQKRGTKYHVGGRGAGKRAKKA